MLTKANEDAKLVQQQSPAILNYRITIFRQHAIATRQWKLGAVTFGLPQRRSQLAKDWTVPASLWI